MLPCQKHLFALDPGVHYLDSAAVGPMPLSVVSTAHESASSKARPWLRERARSHARVAELRRHGAALVGAQPQDMAIVGSASYGLAVARRNLPLAADDTVLLLAGEHASQQLTWKEHARACQAQLREVAQPADRDWTRAILEHLDHPGDAPSIASLCANFWTDGSLIDLPTVCARLRTAGTRIVLDLTQSAGVVDIDVAALDVDFAVFPTYKWLLGPYSTGLLYAAPRWHQGTPLEDNGFNRDAPGHYLPGAARFDMGERDVFIGIPTAITALELIHSWDRGQLRQRLAHLTGRLAECLQDLGYDVVPSSRRCPHILGIHGVPAGAADFCRSRGVYLTQRGHVVRISPHVFNDDADVDACIAALHEFQRHR